jgi:uncharacterized protein (DUF1697 family)
VQSGNVVFSTSERNGSKVSKRIAEGIEREFGFRTDVIVRSAEEMRGAVARNPFAKRRDIEPGKFLVLFLDSQPSAEAREKLNSIRKDREELRLDGRELYIYFPDGVGRSKVSTAAIERVLQTTGTGRNWNSVTKLLELAEALSSAS